MANSPGADSDDDLSDLYKEYTGPLGSKATTVPDNVQTNVKSNVNSDEEKETHDPNAIPTDFTSREAKVWEAKSKATERNWKKRKDEEMICKICGESGHFTQGCPSTLGNNRKSQDFFERVPGRDPKVRALFTEKVIEKIEKDFGCKIKMEEKFIIVSGKDRLILKKGVDAVNKVREEGERKDSSGPRLSRSRSPPQRSLVGSRLGRSDPPRSHPSPQKAPQRSYISPQIASQRSHLSPQNAPQRSHLSPQNAPQRSHLSSQIEPQFQHRFSRQDTVVEDNVRDDLLKMTRVSPSAYGNNGARGQSSRSRSPTRHLYTTGGSYNVSDGHGQSMGDYRSDGRASLQVGRNSEQPIFQQTLEELELEYKREATELGRARDKEEDEENNRHREAVREIRENYMKTLGILRGSYGKQWDDFLRLDIQRRQEQQAHPHQRLSSPTGFGGYKQPPNYPPPEYNSRPVGNHDHYGGPNTGSMDSSRGKFSNSVDNSYGGSSRHHDGYGDFPRQRREEYGKTYNRY